MGKLNAVQIRSLKEPGRYSDGGGLLLNVKPTGTKSWLLRLQSHGRRRDYGLGSLNDVTLADARERAAEFRKMLRAGIDPLAANTAERIPTFREVAAMVHGEHKRGWRNGKHQAQWLATLETYVFPKVGDRTVNAVESRDVRDALAEIWLTKPETARRVRQRIGAVLDYAFAKGWREHETPMRSVTKGLPRQPRKTGRFEAMPFSEVPAFVASLRGRASMGRLALEALVLTAARSGEVRGALWSELDLEAKTWTIPAERMKAGKTHVIPLSPAALNVFERARALRLAGADLVFPGLKAGRPLSDMTLMKVLRDANLTFTAHGFRSSFRDWVAEETNVPGEIAEAALAHAISNRVEAAYRRTDFLEKRRKLMEAWGSYCAQDRDAIKLAAV